MRGKSHAVKSLNFKTQTAPPLALALPPSLKPVDRMQPDEELRLQPAEAFQRPDSDHCGPHGIPLQGRQKDAGLNTNCTETLDSKPLSIQDSRLLTHDSLMLWHSQAFASTMGFLHNAASIVQIGFFGP